MVKNPPIMQETWVQSLGWEDPLEEGIEPTPVFLPRESPRTEEPNSNKSWNKDLITSNTVLEGGMQFLISFNK